MEGFNMTRNNTAIEFDERAQYFHFQYFPTNFTKNAYIIKAFPLEYWAFVQYC